MSRLINIDKIIKERDTAIILLKKMVDTYDLGFNEGIERAKIFLKEKESEANNG